jgi:glucokinase
VLVLNDFTALALSIPQLAGDGVRQVGRGSPQSGSAIAVVGPGTGLGVSGLVPHGDRWLPLSGEGGHVSYGGMDEHENDLLHIVRERYGHVSAERLLSGPGLVNLYQATAERAGLPAEDLSPGEISGRGLQGLEPFAQVLDQFCGILGTVAGNLALTLGAAGGVYLGGGIVPRLGQFLDRSSFRTRFEAHGRLSAWLETVPTYVIQAPNPALIGAARALFSN